jgi:hypothetical protein
LFPVGTESSYRPANLSFTNAPSAGGTITASFTASSPGTLTADLDDAGFEITTIAQEGFWTLTNNGISGGTYSLDLNASGFGVSDFTQLHLIKRANSSSDWGINGNHAPSDGSLTSPVVHRTGMTGFSDFAVASKDGILPVELKSFKVSCLHSNSIIIWQTASELNNDYFILEKSTDMRNFYEMARIKGAGNSNELLSYSFVDENAAGIQNFYRLTQVDFDGTKSISKVIAIMCDSDDNTEPSISAYPNPFNNNINLIINNPEREAFSIEIFDNSSKIVFEKYFTEFESLNEISIDLSNLTPGIYVLRYMSDKYSINKKIVKQ